MCVIVSTELSHKVCRKLGLILDKYHSTCGIKKKNAFLADVLEADFPESNFKE
jgi:hypothetical protein